MNITLRQLKIFEAVTRHLNFTKASEELHLTQPAVSMQIKQLEQAIEIPLFDQVGKRISLTEAGEELQRYSRSISTLLQEAEQVLLHLTGIFGLIEEMRAVNTDGVEPMAHAQDLTLRLRGAFFALFVLPLRLVAALVRLAFR